jgi:16S rRNA (guanine527-N7)-methyltransferase
VSRSRPPPADLVSLFSRSSCPLSPDRADLLGAYLELLLRWSRRVNLTGFREPLAAAEGLLYDGAELAPLLPAGAAVLDVGAGAGGLAVTLAVLRPDLGVRLVEPREKRAAFLRAVVRELGLSPRLQVVQARAEALRGLPDPAPDAAYARAVMPPEQWIPLGASLLRPGGHVLCLTASPLAALGVAIPPALSVEAERVYALPITGASRVVTALRVPERGAPPLRES